MAACYYYVKLAHVVLTSESFEYYAGLLVPAELVKGGPNYRTQNERQLLWALGACPPCPHHWGSCLVTCVSLSLPSPLSFSFRYKEI